MKAVSRVLKLRPPLLVGHYSFLRANGHVITKGATDSRYADSVQHCVVTNLELTYQSPVMAAIQD